MQNFTFVITFSSGGEEPHHRFHSGKFPGNFLGPCSGMNPNQNMELNGRKYGAEWKQITPFLLLSSFFFLIKDDAVHMKLHFSLKFTVNVYLESFNGIEMEFQFLRYIFQVYLEQRNTLR